MKKNAAWLFLFTLFIFSKSITAQVTQLELTTGFYKSDFSSLTIKSLDDKNKFSVSTLAFFQKFYRKEDFLFDEAGVQTSVYWNFTKNLSVGPSLYYNSVPGFSENLSFRIFIGGSHLVFVAIPAIFHTENDGNINGGLFFQLQYMKRIKREWNYLVNTQVLTEWSRFSTHSRSFQQVRIGVAYKNSQFGAAADLDAYGHTQIWKKSIGIFVRKAFPEK
ncbi:MAG: hypothetical protein Q8941_23550 [Bacteroidota bacterium]|nr:hypothetical protein [Bacteroidota bacterium]